MLVRPLRSLVPTARRQEARVAVEFAILAPAFPLLIFEIMDLAMTGTGASNGQCQPG